MQTGGVLAPTKMSSATGGKVAEDKKQQGRWVRVPVKR